MIRNHAEKSGNQTANAIAHIAGLTDYCFECGRWVITNVEVDHKCKADANPITDGQVDDHVG